MASHWANILLRTTMLTVSLLSKDDILVVNRKAVTSLNKSLVLKMGMVGSLSATVSPDLTSLLGYHAFWIILSP